MDTHKIHTDDTLGEIRTALVTFFSSRHVIMELY